MGVAMTTHLTVTLRLSGDLTLDLTRMPRGAKSAKTCTLDLMKQDGSVPQISFFKIKHIKGFWPFVVNTDEEVPELAVSWSCLSSTDRNLVVEEFLS